MKPANTLQLPATCHQNMLDRTTLVAQIASRTLLLGCLRTHPEIPLPSYGIMLSTAKHLTLAVQTEILRSAQNDKGVIQDLGMTCRVPMSHQAIGTLLTDSP